MSFSFHQLSIKPKTTDMTIDEIKLLIPKLANQKASVEAVSAFENWLSGASASDVAEISDFYFQCIDQNVLPTLNYENLKSKIELKLDEHDSLASKSQTIAKVEFKYITILKRVSIAATLLLVLGAGYLYKNKLGFGNDLASIEQRYKNDIAPGSNKAILTLSNGESIVLNGLRDGTIKNKDQVTVKKIGNELVYANNTVSNEAIIFNTVSTPKGGQYMLILPDGSKVWLNAASSIRFPVSFNANTREVTIAGEAYFEVAKNPLKPFIVHANELNVQVLGTHFNVMAYNDESAIKTTLLEGSVKLTNGCASTFLIPGKIASLQQKNFTVSDADIDKELAWKNGSFVFNKEGIETIIRQMARWYDVNVIYEGAPPTKAFVGEIKRDATLAESLKIIELSGVHFKIDGRKVIVLE